MIGAIVTSGIGQGEWIPSLTLAPALLIACVYLVWADAGPRPGTVSGAEYEHREIRSPGWAGDRAFLDLKSSVHP